MKVADIFVALGFDVDDAPLKSFDDKVTGLTSDMWAAAAGAAAAVYALGAFVEKAVKGASALRDFNLQTGLSQELLQKWQVTGQLADLNLSAETVTGSIKTLQKTINDVRWGAGDGNAFKWLGLDLMHGQDAFAVLEQLRDNLQVNLQRFGRSRTVQLISQLGLDPGFINALQLSRAEFEKMYKGKILNPEELEKLNKLGLSLKETSLEWQYLTSHITAHFGPELVKVLDSALPLIENIFKGLEKIGDYIENHLPEIKAAMLVLSPIIAAWAIEAHPFITALGLILALIEQIGEYTPGDGSWIDHFLSVTQEIADVIHDILQDTIDLIARLSDLHGWKNIFTTKDENTETADSLSKNDQSQKWKDVLSAPISLKALADLESAIIGLILPPSSAQQAPPASNVNGSVNFNNNYNIHGSADPHEIARTQQIQFNNALESFNNGSRN